MAKSRAMPAVAAKLAHTKVMLVVFHERMLFLAVPR